MGSCACKLPLPGPEVQPVDPSAVNKSQRHADKYKEVDWTKT